MLLLAILAKKQIFAQTDALLNGSVRDLLSVFPLFVEQKLLISAFFLGRHR